MEQIRKMESPRWRGMIGFLILESLFFLLFLFGDRYGKTVLLPASVWKYIVVAAAFCYVTLDFTFALQEDRLSRRRLFLFLAMLLTVTSDVLLLALPEQYAFGVSTFFAAQIFHALQIPQSNRQTAVSFSLRFGATFVILPALGFSDLLTPLYAATAFYAPQLIGNLIEHLFGIFRAAHPEEKRRSILLFVGFALFFGCDLCLGLSTIGFSGTGYWIWIFYAPSQVLIAISCGPLGRKGELKQ